MVVKALSSNHWTSGEFSGRGLFKIQVPRPNRPIDLIQALPPFTPGRLTVEKWLPGAPPHGPIREAPVRAG